MAANHKFLTTQCYTSIHVSFKDSRRSLFLSDKLISHVSQCPESTSCFPVQQFFQKNGYFRKDFIKGVLPLGNFLRYLLRYATLATELWASAFLGLCGGCSSGAAGSLMDEPIVPWLCDKWTNTGWRITVEGAVRQWMVSKRPENMTAAARC